MGQQICAECVEDAAVAQCERLTHIFSFLFGPDILDQYVWLHSEGCCILFPNCTSGLS